MKNRILIQLFVVVQIIIYIQINVLAQIQFISDTCRTDFLHLLPQLTLTSPDEASRSGGIGINIFRDSDDQPIRLIEGAAAHIEFTPFGDIMFKTAEVGAANTQIEFTKSFIINNTGQVIFPANTNNSDTRLIVCGTIGAEEIKVKLGWCDFVFNKGYDRPSLWEEKKFIQRFGHLSGFLSEADMAGEIYLGDIIKRQQIKLEEGFLHLIDLNEASKTILEENTELKKEVTKLKNGYNDLKKELDELKALLTKQ